MRCVPKVLPKFQAKVSSRSNGMRPDSISPFKPLRFRFTENSPNPTLFRVTYYDETKKWWLDGVEHLGDSSFVELIPDDGSIEHTIEVGAFPIKYLYVRNSRLQFNVEDMQNWPLDFYVNLYGNRDTLSGDLTKLNWNLKHDFYLGFNENVFGAVHELGWTLDGSCYMMNMSVSGDIFLAGFSLTNLAYFHNSAINHCSQPLSTWTPTSVYFYNCPLDTSSVDNVVIGLDQGGRTDGILRIENTSVPSQIGLDAISNLEAKGWTVTYDS